MEKYTCPICGVELDFIERYPRYICSKCASLASDIDGNGISFFNEDLSGGITGIYTDTGKPYNGNLCFIKGVKCRADEARFGGIVIQPEE